MDYSKLKAPFVHNETIKLKAEEFRKDYWDKKLPVDIEKIIDVRLEINIVPILNLEEICNTDTLITSDWKSLYIDDDLFNDERRQNRLRFSLAHEIGHYILHQEFYSSLRINSFEDFYSFIDSIQADQYGYIEAQANKFAGHLLVPRDILVGKFKKELEKVSKYNFDKALLRSYIANPLSREFGISQESMEIVLGELDIFKN